MSQSITNHRAADAAPAAAGPAQERSATGPASRAMQWLRRTVPTLVVISALAGLAVWGHSTEWKIPKFSALVGGQPTEDADWCEEHNVPESECIECDASLVPAKTDYGWCKVHGVAQCPLEHPDVAQVNVPPDVSTDDLERARRALALRPWTENNSLCKLHTRRIQFASVEAMAKAGIDIAVVRRHPIVEAVVANGEVIYDETHAAQLASRVAGTVWRTDKQVGDRVRKGDVLAVIDAAEVGKAKGELLQSISQVRLKSINLERLKPLAADGSVPGRQFREAEAALQEAHIRLRGAVQSLVNLGFSVRADEFAELSTDDIADRIQFLGLPSDTVSDFVNNGTGFDGNGASSNLFPLRTPLEGVVVGRNVVAGEVVDTATTLFRVADVRRMWLMLNVRQDDARYLSLGQKVLFRPSDGGDEAEFEGELAWISTEADDQTRTVKVRVDLPNDNGRLRANTFGAGRIVLREEPRAIVVPREAVHWDGDCNLVFVRDKNFLKKGAPKFFHVRKVRVGVKQGDLVEIIAGLVPGEIIAAKNSVVIEAQLMKNDLGAGCGCCEGQQP